MLLIDYIADGTDPNASWRRAFLMCEVVNYLAVLEQNHFVASFMPLWLSWLGCFIEGLSSFWIRALAKTSKT